MKAGVECESVKAHAACSVLHTEQATVPAIVPCTPWYVHERGRSVSRSAPAPLHYMVPSMTMVVAAVAQRRAAPRCHVACALDPTEEESISPCYTSPWYSPPTSFHACRE